MSRVRYLRQEEWMGICDKVGLKSRVESIVQTREAICRSCVVAPLCSEMCEEFVSGALRNEKFIPKR